MKQKINFFVLGHEDIFSALAFLSLIEMLVLGSASIPHLEAGEGMVFVWTVVTPLLVALFAIVISRITKNSTANDFLLLLVCTATLVPKIISLALTKAQLVREMPFLTLVALTAFPGQLFFCVAIFVMVVINRITFLDLPGITGFTDLFAVGFAGVYLYFKGLYLAEQSVELRANPLEELKNLEGWEQMSVLLEKAAAKLETQRTCGELPFRSTDCKRQMKQLLVGPPTTAASNNYEHSDLGISEVRSLPSLLAEAVEKESQEALSAPCDERQPSQEIQFSRLSLLKDAEETAKLWARGYARFLGRWRCCCRLRNPPPVCLSRPLSTLAKLFRKTEQWRLRSAETYHLAVWSGSPLPLSSTAYRFRNTTIDRWYCHWAASFNERYMARCTFIDVSFATVLTAISLINFVSELVTGEELNKVWRIVALSALVVSLAILAYSRAATVVNRGKNIGWMSVGSALYIFLSIAAGTAFVSTDYFPIHKFLSCSLVVPLRLPIFAAIIVFGAILWRFSLFVSLLIATTLLYMFVLFVSPMERNRRILFSHCLLPYFKLAELGATLK